MKKKIGYSLLTLLIIAITAGFFGIRKFNTALFKEKPNRLEFTYDDHPIHFDWASDSIGGYYEAQAAMIVPLTIEGLAHQFYMQFDTGSPYTFIYENDVNSLRAIGLPITEVVKDEARYVEHLDFILGKTHIKASMIKILENYGNTFTENDTLHKIGIGTIGSDVMGNCITAIDFKNQKIQFYNNRPDWLSGLSGFKKFNFTGRRIMLPVVLDNKNYEFFYDTGCSAFGLITTKNRFDRYTEEHIKEVSYDANSWGNGIPMRSKATEKTFSVGNANLHLKRVTYIDMYTYLQPLMTPFTRIGGWLGNQPFNESTLVIDTKKEEFLVITN